MPDKINNDESVTSHLLPPWLLHITNDPEQSTFMHDEGLPSLPLPSLQDTLTRYVASVRPLVSATEAAATAAAAARFLDGVGPSLQRSLELRAATHRNWLEDWWLQHAYLSFRRPLIPFLNTGGPHTIALDRCPPDPDRAFQYGAMFVYTMLLFYVALREERLRPQVTFKGQKLSMEQFRRVFNTCRVPGIHRDTLQTCWTTKREGDCPGHIVLLCRGHVWKLHPWDDRGYPITPPELEAAFRHVKAASTGAAPGVGALTADTREVWAQNREHLAGLSDRNRRNLAAVETAVCVFALDSSTPASMSEAVDVSLGGATEDRWADKSLCGIITRNGYVAVNNDHTPYDGMALVVLTHFQHSVMFDVLGGNWESSGRSTSVRADLLPPELLHFDVDDKLRAAIHTAKINSARNNSSVLASFRSYEGFGKTWMKSSGAHPDSFVQMVLQRAYYATHHKVAPTYETATTRQFYHGRTETVRSCTAEAKKFVEAMDDHTLTDAERRRLLLAACASHARLMSEAKQGQGVDRHLLGLYLTAVDSGLPIPDLFTEPGFTKAGGGGNYVLSTSTIGYTNTLGGAAPMVPHGYGCFYSMLPDRIYLFVTSFRDGGTLPAEEFSAVICNTFTTLQALMNTAHDATTPAAVVSAKL